MSHFEFKIPKSLPRAAVGVIASLLLLVGCSSGADSTDAGAASADFCTPEGLMEAVPSLRNAEGQLEIPDPTKDLDAFYSAHQSVTRAIDTALVQASNSLTPAEAAEQIHKPLTFGPAWRSAEVGLGALGDDIVLEEKKGKRLASYGGPSFLSGIKPVPGTNNGFYQIDNQTEVASLVTPQATNLPCVNRLLLAEASAGGMWVPPSYAIGPEGGDAFFIVDLCLENVSVLNDQVGPGASLYVAIQWADIPAFKHMQTEQKSIMHQGHSF